MPQFTRRHFLSLTGSAAALAACPAIIKAQSASTRILVVGGGFAGATVAKYLRHWGNNIQVSLIEPNAAHVSCILSNLVLNQTLTLDTITFKYSALQQQYGVEVIQDGVIAINGARRQVRLRSNRRLSYDRLVVAPGVSFDSIPGLRMHRIPHAWQAGAQTLLLQKQLQAMPAGGVFVMTIPLAPYRCPPGPYERACVVADYVRRTKPGSQVIVLDANPGIVAERETFTRAFTQTFAGIVDYVPNTTLLEVDSANRVAITSAGRFQADVLNVIPRQKAAQLVFDAGLVNDPTGRWAGVNPLSYESTAMPGVHIIGDSQGTGQPKAGHIANAEAKVCADAIIRLLAGEAPDPAPMTNSACYSPITLNTASWLTAVFAYDPVSGTMKAVLDSAGEAPRVTRENFAKMFDWANNLFADTFR